MANYFEILGLDCDASLIEIKKSYRTRVKLYHPDVNHAPGAREKFMEIHEAYEYLMDERRRHYLAQDLLRRKISDEELRRREAYYRTWVDQQRKAAVHRATEYAESPFDEFRKSRIYRTAMKVNRGYNYLFIALCLAMIAAPLFRLATDKDTSQTNNPWWHLFFPIVVGLIFSGFGYYYLFIWKVDDE